MMKTFEQRKSEIRRRSEKRIVKRRQWINRLTGAVVCLLCVAAVVAFRPGANHENAAFDEKMYGSSANEACEPAGQPEVSAGGAIPETYQFTFAEAEELQLQVTRLDLEDNSVTAALSNYSGAMASYSPGYDIEYRTEDGWFSCAEGEKTQDWVLYLLEAGDTVTKTYPLTGFDISQSGTYRLVQYCNLYIEEDSTPYRVVAEFTVEEKALEP